MDAYDARYSQATLALLGKQLLRMAGNPTTRRSILNAHQANTPGFVMPPDVQMQQFREEQAKKERDAKIARDNEKVAERHAAQREKLMQRYTPEQIAEIETKVM